MQLEGSAAWRACDVIEGEPSRRVLELGARDGSACHVWLKHVFLSRSSACQYGIPCHAGTRYPRFSSSLTPRYIWPIIKSMKKRIQLFSVYLFPSWGALLWMSAFFGALALGRQMINTDGDLGRHITVGNYILDNGVIPVRDVFSYTMAGQPATPHEWLAQVIFALSHRLMELNGPVLVSSLVIATAFWLVWLRTRTERKNLLPVVLVAFLATAASCLHWLARPHIFTFLLLALWMIVLHQMSSGKPGRWWLLPVLMLVWANIHGAFFAGLVTWALFGAGMAWKACLRKMPEREELPPGFWPCYLLGGAAALLASLINPAGIGLWKTSLGYVTNQYLVGHTIEYMPPSIQNANTWLFWIFSALLVPVMALRPVRQRSEMLFPAAAWLVMALYSARNIPLFLIVSAPLLAQGLEELLNRSVGSMKLFKRFLAHDARLFEIDSTLKGPILPVVCIIIAIIGFRAGFRFDVGRRGNGYDPAVFPVEAVSWMKDHPQNGHMFNYFTWGGYLLYRQWPENRVFIDGQTDFYGESLTRQYVQVISQSKGWEQVLDAYRVEWVILPATEPAVEALRSKPGWMVVYEDRTTAIIRRTE